MKPLRTTLILLLKTTFCLKISKQTLQSKITFSRSTEIIFISQEKLKFIAAVVHNNYAAVRLFYL